MNCPGYQAAPGKTGLSPVHGALLRNPATSSPGGLNEERNSFSERLFIIIVASVLAIGWGGLFLAELGIFSTTGLTAGVVAMAGLALVLSRRRPMALPRPGQQDLPLLGLVILGAVLFFRPHEFVLGGADAGVYLNTGVHLARSGMLLIHDAGLPDLRPEVVPALLRAAAPASGVAWLRLPGYYIGNLETGTVIPQFFSLQAVWVAIFYTLGGLTGALLATPFLGLLGLVAVYMAAHALFGDQRLAFTAALLLALTPTQIWFSRYPTAEALTQFLTFNGIFAFTRAMQAPHRGRATLAGAALGTVFLARADAFPILVPVVAYLAYLLLTGRWHVGEKSFFLALALLLGYSASHAVLFVRPYTAETFRAVLNVGAGLLPSLPWLWVTGGAVAIVGGLWLIQRAARPAIERAVARWQSRLGWPLAAGLVVAATYAYFVRPFVEQPQTFFYWYGETWLRTYDAENLARLGWYVTPLGLLLGVGGYAALLTRDLSRRTWFFLALALLFSFMYIWRIANNPHHIYAVRRYVPVVIPALCIAASYALWGLWHKFSTRRWGRAVVAGIGLALLLWLSYANRVVAGHVEYAGIIPQLEQLAAVLPADSITIFDDTAVGNTLGTPLQFLYDRETFVLQQSNTDQAALAAQVQDWWSIGKRVFWVVGDTASPAPPSTWPVWMGAHTFDVPVLEQSYAHFPTTVLRWRAALEVYELVPAPRDPALWPTDLGADDFALVRAGFYGKETAPDGTTFRWTSERATFSKPPVGAGNWRFQIHLAAGRPPGVLQPNVRLYCGTTLVTSFVASDTFRTYTVTLPDICASTTELNLLTDSWVPEEYGIGSDKRLLGVAVDWVRFEPQP